VPPTPPSSASSWISRLPFSSLLCFPSIIYLSLYMQGFFVLNSGTFPICLQGFLHSAFFRDPPLHLHNLYIDSFYSQLDPTSLSKYSSFRLITSSPSCLLYSTLVTSLPCDFSGPFLEDQRCSFSLPPPH